MRGGAGASGKKRAARSRGAVPKRGFAQFNTAYRWLLERTNVERLRPSRVDQSMFKLERMSALMERLGNPQESLRCVHVAGTNGKGSVVAMLRAALTRAGAATGAYTSPHLMNVRERITVGGELVSEESFADLVSRVGREAEAIGRQKNDLGEATFFEIMTAMAFLHFAEQAVDVAIVEVGMGGRLDATNVITPEVSVITKIGLDHQSFLGETVEEIAAEKAGIMKEGVPVLTLQQEKGVEAVLRERAEDVGTTLEVLGKEIEYSQRFESDPKLGPHMRIGVTSGGRGFEHVAVPLAGEHQAPNCGLALAVLGKLAGLGMELRELDVVDGLAETRVPGRMEIIGERPRVLLDGAHNPESLGALVKAVGAHVPYDSMVVVFGCAGDKPVDGLLEQVEKIGDKVIFTRAKGNPRAADPEDLAERFRGRSSKMVQVAPTLEEAMAIARRATGRDDLVCVTGSFYLVGEARKLLLSEPALSRG